MDKLTEDLFGLELETNKGEMFTLGHAIGEYCVNQVAIHFKELHAADVEALIKGFSAKIMREKYANILHYFHMSKGKYEDRIDEAIKTLNDLNESYLRSALQPKP